jgi:hypothetical protein
VLELGANKWRRLGSLRRYCHQQTSVFDLHFPNP